MFQQEVFTIEAKDAKNFFGKLDRNVSAFIEHISAISVIALFLIILILVLCRYVLRISVGGLAELPMFLLWLNIWMAAAYSEGKKEHIALDFVGLFVKNKKFHQIKNILLSIIAVAAMGFFSYCAFLEILNTLARNSMSPGLRMPLWWLYACVFFSSVMMTLYNLRWLCVAVKEVRKT